MVLTFFLLLTEIFIYCGAGYISVTVTYQENPAQINEDLNPKKLSTACDLNIDTRANDRMYFKLEGQDDNNDDFGYSAGTMISL